MDKEFIYSFPRRKDPKARLLERSVKRPNGCVEYRGSKDSGGYGKFTLGGRSVGAHKVSYVLSVGPVPKGKVVMHSCDNPSCINPDHLSLGSQKDNIHDSISKGRFPDNTHALKHPPRRIIVGHNDSEMLVFTDIYALRAAGFTDGWVSRCANGKRDKYRGYTWSYEDREDL